MLRALVMTLGFAMPVAALAEEHIVTFSDGSGVGLGIAIPQALDEASRLGEAWEDSLDIQAGDAFGRDIDVDALRERALNNPRVRALLGADEGQTLDAAGDKRRYEDQHAFLFASFAMPPASLKAMLREGERLNVPVIFRGFVDNSVYATQTAMEVVFGEDEDISGFTIDPTMFVRFDVEVVPTLVVARDVLEPCVSSGCESDIMPVHDRLAGNIPLAAALEIVAGSGGDAATRASRILARQEGLE